MGSTESHIKTETKLERISWVSSRDSKKVYQNLMHLFNESAFEKCFNELDGRKAVGTDGIDKTKYLGHLGENLKDLVARMKRMAYRPGPVRQVLIPKPGKPDEKRPLGISNFEDKIVQKMMKKVLESIYEPLFLDCSYGFRPGRGCHDAIRDLRDHLVRRDVQIVIDVDLRNFFGTIDHKELEQMLREKLRDDVFMRYIIRMFKAGVLSQGELQVSSEGVAQGSLCSPVLSNIFAHFVIDQWFEEVVKRHCRGDVKLFRYCDDCVICCQFESDAIRIRKALSQRLARFKLSLNEEKTTLVNFSKKDYQKENKQEVFDFLGFTFYWGISRKGKIIPKVKTSGKRYREKLKRVSEWARTNRNKVKLKQLWRTFCIKLQGHIGYYGVSFNGKRVGQFLYCAVRILFKWLNRRSQRRSFDWDRFNLFIKANPLPKNKVYHTLY